MLARAVCLKVHGGSGGLIVNDPDVMGVGQAHGLRISFDVALTGGVSTAAINVYNLSRGVNSGLSSQVDDNTVVELWVGYGVANKVLYKGILKNVSVQKQGTDIITTFYAIDFLDTPKDRVKVDRNFPIQTARQTVVSTLVGDLIKGNPLLQQGYLGAFTGTLSRETKITGHVVEELQKVCREEKHVLTLTNNMVNIYQLGVGSFEPPFLITSDTGLISTPVISLEAVDFSTMLDVRLKPFQKVTVSSFRYNIGDNQFDVPLGDGSISNLLLLTVNHSGDTHSGTWQSSVRGSVMEFL